MKGNTAILVTLVMFALINFATAQDMPLIESRVLHAGKTMTHNGRLYRSYQLEPGENLVFEYTSNNAGDPGNHSAAETMIAFQIPDDETSFHFADSDIDRHGGVYMQRCHCQDEGIQAIKDGTITGKKEEDGTWYIQIDISIEGRRTGRTYEIEDSGTYHLIE